MSCVKNKKTLSIIVLWLIILLCFMTMAINVNAAMAKGSKWVGNIIAGSVPSNYMTYWNHSSICQHMEMVTASNSQIRAFLLIQMARYICIMVFKVRICVS